MNHSSSPPRVRSVRYDLRIREVEVVRAERISPGFMGVTFGGDALADFVSGSFDDHVKFLITGADGERTGRHYTARRFDAHARELTIEFGLRGNGPCADWARNAKPGQRAAIGGPKSSLIVPMDCDWHLLVGDATALPAIHRRLEELPTGAMAIVRVHLPDARDRRVFGVPAAVDVEWASDPEELVSSVRSACLPGGSGFAWAAGEAELMGGLKPVLCDEKGLTREALRIGVYWKKGSSDFHESLAKPPAEAA